MCYSTDFLVYINIAPWNNSCGAREFFKLLPWIFREIWNILKTLIVKSRIFSRELGWSLIIRAQQNTTQYNSQEQTGQKDMISDDVTENYITW